MERKSDGTFASRDIDERFWEKVRLEDDIFPENGCMIWTGGKDQDGYGMFWSGSDTRRAVRWIYQRLRGPIPTDMQLDHLCRNRACVNPDHVEVVTLQTNIARGESGKGPRIPRTHCKHGHEFTLENTYFYLRDGTERRGCRICRNENHLHYWHSLPEETRKYWSRKTSEYRKKK